MRTTTVHLELEARADDSASRIQEAVRERVEADLSRVIRSHATTESGRSVEIVSVAVVDPMEEPTTPIVHLNGTSREGLLEQLSLAERTLNDAIAALVEARPHQRDYYMTNDGRWDRANRQHLSRMRRLQSVREELRQMERGLSL